MPTPAASPPPESGDPITVYSGRNEDLIGPLVAMFEEATGIEADVRYGNPRPTLRCSSRPKATPHRQMSSSPRAPAPWAIWPPRTVFGTLPAGILDAVDAGYRAERRHMGGLQRSPGASSFTTPTSWTRRTFPTPSSTSPTRHTTAASPWRRPTVRSRTSSPPCGSSPATMPHSPGSRAWRPTTPPTIPKNSAIVDAVLRGEVDMGLVNHYYLLRFLAEDPGRSGHQPQLRSRRHRFAADRHHRRDPQHVSDQPTAAQAFVEFMLTRPGPGVLRGRNPRVPASRGRRSAPPRWHPLNIEGVHGHHRLRCARRRLGPHPGTYRPERHRALTAPVVDPPGGPAGASYRSRSRGRL